MTERRPSRPKPKEAARRGHAVSVAETLPAIGDVAFRRFGFVQSAIVSRWPEIVGERYAAVSAPESIRFPPAKKADGTLTLTVAGAHAPMMQHVTPAIVERVNRFFGYRAVARVQFRQGVLPAARRKSVATPPPPAPAEMGDSLRAIADPEFRAVLESLAAGVAATGGLPRIG